MIFAFLLMAGNSFADEKILNVLQNPFSPTGGGRYREALITYHAPRESVVSIRIFNVNGQPIKNLVSHQTSFGNELKEVTWNGRSDSGARVPIGIYIVVLEMKSPNGNRTEQKTVVVGRRL